MYILPQPLGLRDATAGDQEFLDALYFSSREDLQQMAADPAFVAQLIKLQQRAQQIGIEDHYPDARHLILEDAGRPVGRVVLHAGPADIRLVDISILPEARGSGMATQVLRALQAGAAAQGLGMSLAVSKTNPAARSLYLGLGFKVVSEDEVFEQMAWRAESA